MLEERTMIADTAAQTGKEVILFGWVNSIRDHGKIIFIDLRDRSGLVQIVGQKKDWPDLKTEFVLRVRGKVKERPAGLVNADLATGKIEIALEEVTVLATAKDLPFDIYGSGAKINDTIRLKYRYLDIRRPRVKKNLQRRHQLLHSFRQHLIEEDFWEIDTPNLSKSTPEGARDFLVPSRLQPGKFYALPQSPQQYKQLLMVGGVEKYFQIATCFRDEDLRADRQLEFKQIDIEMSFVDREDVLKKTETLIKKVMADLGAEIAIDPFPRLTYQEAMTKYHTDKPDLRKKKDSSKLAFCWVLDFPLFEKTVTKAITPVHHPFTSPNPADLPLLDKKPLKVRSWQYDLVCNGWEVGGGSIRITDPQIQSQIFRILGHSQKEIEQRFGHLLEAFEYGVPPHGGIALGFDRLLALISGEANIREVIPFPVNAAGVTAVMNAPTSVDKEQLEELGIRVVVDNEKD